MPKRKNLNDVNQINRRFREGRGQGEGKDYTPYINIHDFSSHGLVHRVKGLTTGRLHHLFSNGEYAAFMEFDWEKNIVDIREQYPLDRFETFEIANKKKIKHPRCNDGSPSVLTTDFLLTVEDEHKKKW
jgi:hypothetical protein